MNYSLRSLLLILCFSLIGGTPLFTQTGGEESDQDGHIHRPGHPVCGTFLYMELEANRNSLSEKEQQLLSELKATTRLELQKNIVSLNGHFRIHFDTLGANAPSLVDLNGNGLPDYIDSVNYYMEFAWEKEIDECGFTTPPPDNPRPGTGGIDGKIDVFIKELSGDIYGLAYTDLNTQLGPNRVPGYLYLDNDYRGYPTSGIAGLRVTSAHEFHHIVQFSAYRYDLSQAALYEATSTWMEYKVHPDVNDFRYYFNVFLKAPQNYAFSTHASNRDGITGYAHMHYLQSIVQQLDANIVRDIWTEFKNSGRSFDAINAALLKTGSGLNLANSYCTFAHWSYYTGTHAVDSTYFAKAELYPTIVAVEQRQMPTEGETGFVGSLMPLSFGVWRLKIPRNGGLLPDTVDFLVTNARSDIGTGGLVWLNNPESFTLDISNTAKENYLSLNYGTNQLFYRLTAPHQDFCVEPIINGSPGIIAIASPTPQPFYNDGADKMVFAVKLGAETMVTNVHMDIYSASMTHVASINRTELEKLENLQGIVWNGEDERGEPVPSGVYIYTLSINGSEPSVGKFAVVKR